MIRVLEKFEFKKKIKTKINWFLMADKMLSDAEVLVYFFFF
jgi:hypothetical protein